MFAKCQFSELPIVLPIELPTNRLGGRYVIPNWPRPKAPGAHMGQGPGPLGPSYRVHMESLTTYCQADYLLSGKQRQSGMHPTAP